MAIAKAKAASKEMQVLELTTGTAEFCIVGTSPVILNRMSQKALQTLLLPAGRKTAAEKKSNVKHDPLSEYRESPYKDESGKGETVLQLLSSMFKASMRGAALDVPGATKAAIGRLLWVNSERVELFGVPQLMMSVTRSADIGKTPDVRTRAIVPRWATRISVSFVEPNLTAAVVANLLAAAGMIQGVGDWRPEKGSGNYGQFRLCSADDAEYLSIIKSGGRDAQAQALIRPEMYDDETRTLYEWFQEESGSRGLKVAS